MVLPLKEAILFQIYDAGIKLEPINKDTDNFAHVTHKYS